MSIDRCLRTVIEETGTTMPKEDVAAIVEMMVAYDQHPRNRQVFGPFSPEQGRIQTALENPTTQRLTEARDIMIARARLVAAQQQANVIANATKRAERFATYGNAPSRAMGIQAKLVGTNTPFLGSRNSAAAVIEGNLHNLVGTFDQELKAAHLDDVFASRQMEREWALELHQLNSTDGTPGVTNNPRALQLAQIIQNFQRRAVDMLNREGAFIGSYDGYIARTTHSPDLIRTMGEDAWLGLAHTYFDLDTIYPNRDEAFINNALRDQYKRIVSGIHDEYDPEQLGIVSYAPGQNLAKKVSESRVIHFKDGQAWLDYMAQASDYTPTQVIFKSGQRAAQDAALMRVWGTNPKAALEEDLSRLRHEARDASDWQTLDELNRQQKHYDLWMKYMTGEANRVVNKTWAAITANTLAWQRLAKLGFLPFAQLTDLSSLMGELRYQGVGFMDRITAGLTSYFRGGVDSEKRQVADLLNAYLEGEMADHGVLMETNDPRISGTFSGRMNQLQSWFFRYTGAAAMTNRARGSLMYMMARHMGQFHMQDFNALGLNERRIMSAFDIGEREWNALSQADWTQGVEGNRYLTPRDAMSIPDEALHEFHADDIAELEAARNQALEDRVQRAGNNQERIAAAQELDRQQEARDEQQIADMFDRTREDLSQRLYSYYADRMNYGVLNPGVAERAILYQGSAPDSALGTSLRLALQFKSFMVASIRRVWGREWYGQDGAGAMAGLIEYAVLGTILGVAANAMNSLFKGQNPVSQWQNNPTAAIISGFTRAGSASIIGDFAFGNFNRNGQTLAGYLLGPTIGAGENVVRMMNAAMNPTGVGVETVPGEMLRFARSMTPLLNSFYTKMAADYLVWNGLLEMSSPGFLRRQERNMRENQGIEYLPPFNPSAMRAF